MWPLCDFSLPAILWLLGPLILGLLTAWWVWGTRKEEPVIERKRVITPATVAEVEPAPEVAEAPTPEAVPEPATETEVVAEPEPTPEPTPAPVSAPEPTAAPTPDPAPVAAAAADGAVTAIGIPAAVGDPDNLRQIKGIGPKLNDLLISLGVTRFDQIAGWGSAEIANVDEHLGAFTGRIDRDNWVEQAGLLAKGDIAAFEAKFGSLGGQTQ